jgi:DNA (cytosine-5)-methyltransferase 1
MGYFRAGFDVVGIDIAPHPTFPFAFIQADALAPPVDLRAFDLIHASPPCQAFTRAGHLRTAQGGEASTLDLLGMTRDMLQASGVPYVIENVPGAPMTGVTLCGSMFGLKVRRHRLFETWPPLILTPICDHPRQGRPIGVYHRMNDEVPQGGRTARTLEEGQRAMGIDWMEWDDLKEAIPPAYTEWLGRQMLDALRETEAA